MQCEYCYMNCRELIDFCAAELQRAGIANFRNEARWLVLETLKLTTSALYREEQLTAIQHSQATCALERRCRREPLQYILGSAPFGEIELKVSPAVLIPRVETEVLVDYLVEHLPENGSLLDVGCGSGAIALLTAVRRRDIQVTAVDKSAEALAVAAENCSRLQLDDRVRLIESDLLSRVGKTSFDLIAANLPYVTFDEYETLEPEVRCYEPQLALTAAAEGLSLIFELIRQLPDFLAPDGIVVLEMSPHQTGRVQEFLAGSGFVSGCFADQFGKYRFVAARRG